MSAVRSTPPPSLVSEQICQDCGGSFIDLWRSITTEDFICRSCLLTNEQRPPGDLLLCPGSKFGCKYQTGIARNCVDHLRTCPRRPTQCPNECFSIISNTDLPRHLTEECPRRTKECRFCHGNYFVCEIGNHFRECQDYPVTCQYCNQENIRRGSLEEHGAGCRKTPKLCKMASSGCTFKAGDDEMERHMTLEKHTFCMQEMKVQVNSLEVEIRQVREECSREKQERQKQEEVHQKELRIRDEQVRRLRNEVEALLRQVGQPFDNPIDGYMREQPNHWDTQATSSGLCLALQCCRDTSNFTHV
ncbi:TNF receptor-associated factor 4-like [Ornithodoros turicata]|uniref:TNF receptor-associated factor 4-like n=1 Tax=Ornithodoros turicata TaxID=34597 RepID=UPI003139279B